MIPVMVGFQRSNVDRGRDNDKAMETAVKTHGLVRGGIEVDAADQASRQRARDFLTERLHEMIHNYQMLAALPREYEVADAVASGAGYSTVFEGGVFFRAVRPQLVGFLDKYSEGGLRTLLEPADIESEVAQITPTSRRDWGGTRETARVAMFVGNKLHDATLAALDRVVPRVIAATLKNPDRALNPSDVPHHGYLDSAVVTALLEQPSPLTVVRTPEQIAADNQATAKREQAQKRRLKHLDYAELVRMLDQTLLWVNLAREKTAPWVVPISQDLAEWVATHHEHIAGMPEARVRELVSVIEAQHRIVRTAYLGLESIADTHTAPGSSEEAQHAPEYAAMHEYAMAISHSRSSDDADRHLAQAEAHHQKLSVSEASHSLRAARTTSREAQLGENEGVAHPTEVAETAQREGETAAWWAGQDIVAGRGADAAQVAEARVAADERAAVDRLRGIARKIQRLAVVAQTVDATSALRTLLTVSKPINQARFALENALAQAARDYKAADGADAARVAWQTQRREAVAKASQALADIVKENDLESVFARAQSEIKDAQIRKISTLALTSPRCRRHFWQWMPHLRPTLRGSVSTTENCILLRSENCPETPFSRRTSGGEAVGWDRRR